MKVVLLSTYELGHQPFGLSSPKAWLERDGHEVVCADLSRSPLPGSAIREADAAGIYLPMHTATRLALPVIERVKKLHPRIRLACYGLYAPLNGEMLRSLGAEAILGGEFEAALCAFVRGESSSRPLERLRFLVPDRSGLPAPSRYAQLHQGSLSRPVAYTEASRGCKHWCRHCPVVPVYQGQFRVVQPEIVLADIRQQISAGASHVTFGDPDFLNGPAHAMRIVEALYTEFPWVSYDVTVKIEHLLKHHELLPGFKRTGCLFITSAVEAVDDAVLQKLDKGHTRAGFAKAAALLRDAGLVLHPTFIAFTPWTTVAGYRDLLGAIAELGLVENTAPVQLALRLLITPGSRLLELQEIRDLARPLDAKSLVHPWSHPNPAVDGLAAQVFGLVHRLQKEGASRGSIFQAVWDLAGGGRMPENYGLLPRAAIPYLDEPWYC